MLFLRERIWYTEFVMERIELYNQNMLPPARRKRTCVLAAILILGILALTACVLFCVFTTRKNLRITLPLTIVTSVVAGWIEITLIHGLFGRASAEYKHCGMMLKEPRETQSGRFEKTDDVRRIGNGISVRKVRVSREEHEQILSVAETLANKLPDRFSGTAQTVYDFIVAFEVDGDD